MNTALDPALTISNVSDPGANHMVSRRARSSSLVEAISESTPGGHYSPMAPSVAAMALGNKYKVSSIPVISSGSLFDVPVTFRAASLMTLPRCLSDRFRAASCDGEPRKSLNRLNPNNPRCIL